VIPTRVSPDVIPRDIYILVNSFFFIVLGCVSLGLQLCSPGVFMGSGLILVDLAACGRWLGRTWGCPLCLYGISLSEGG
jgi:hypothetical protein